MAGTHVNSGFGAGSERSGLLKGDPAGGGPAAPHCSLDGLHNVPPKSTCQHPDPQNLRMYAQIGSLKR